MTRPGVGELLARYVERHVEDGTRLDPAELCSAAPELASELAARIAAYHALDETLARGAPPRAERRADGALPSFEGFRTVERIGQGGMGEVYKLEDLALKRFVAAKVLRGDRSSVTSVADFLREARSLALFQDPRIVQVLEFRADSRPPVLVMEHVDGFPLAEVAPSLEFTQRARILAEIAEAIHHAHGLGLTHRDLKPANVLLDARLQPKILDFGLASANPREGHGAGTPGYLAPEQLDPSRPLDARTDVHALGVILYEMLCGARPYDGSDRAEVLAAVLRGRPRLPCEVDPAVPEPLQAIALKAMETRPADRYASAREMALDLRRWIDGKPVLAQPTLYASALQQRVRPHLEELDEWKRLNLVHEHEAERLKDAYRRLESREEDWIVQGRSLSWSQVALYLGAFLVGCGGALAFMALELYGEPKGVLAPLLLLGLPFAVVEALAWRLWGTRARAVAVAFHVAALLVLPVFLISALAEARLFLPPEGATGQILWSQFDLSNRQLQVALLASTAWGALLAWRTRTVALSAVFTALLVLLHFALLTDFGLESILDDGEWDRLSARLLPLLVAQLALGWWADATRRAWLASALFAGAALSFVLVLELASIDGEIFRHVGLSLQRLQSPDVSDPALIDMLGAMTVAGLLVHAAGDLAERAPSRSLRPAAHGLLVLAPFATLEPIAWLVHTEDYHRGFAWAYLCLALAVVVSSHFRQRRTWYHAGLLNAGIALWFITDQHDWFDDRAWGAAVTVAGMAALAGGFALHRRERERRDAS